MAGTENFDYVSSWENIIKIWANKAARTDGQYALYNRDYEDIYQELWVKILEAQKSKEGTEEDLRREDNQNKVNTICKLSVIDMKRKDQVRNKEYTVDFTDTGSDEEDSEGYNPYASLRAMGFQYDTPDQIDLIDWHNFVEQFPEDSKERRYLDFWATFTGVDPTTKNIPPKTYKNDGWTRENIAKMLGWADSSSGGYRAFEEKMWKLIADYFGFKKK